MDAKAREKRGVPRAIRTLLIVCLGLVATGTVSGFFGGMWWVLDLASHFRLYYALLALVCAVASVAFGGIRVGGAGVVLTVVNASCLWPLFFGTVERESNLAGTQIQVMTFNVNGYRTQYESVIDWVARSEADIVLILEVRESLHQQLSAFDDYQVVSFPHRSDDWPRQDLFGMALLSRFPVKEIALRFSDDGVPSLTATLNVNGGRLELLAIHPPPSTSAQKSRAHDSELAYASQWSNARVNQPHMLLGDFNATRWSDSFRTLLGSTNLLDSQIGFGYQGSWPTLLPFGLPIDHCLVSPDLQVNERWLGPALGSDHRPLLLQVVVPFSP